MLHNIMLTAIDKLRQAQLHGFLARCGHHEKGVQDAHRISFDCFVG